MISIFEIKVGSSSSQKKKKKKKNWVQLIRVLAIHVNFFFFFPSSFYHIKTYKSEIIPLYSLNILNLDKTELFYKLVFKENMLQV